MSFLAVRRRAALAALVLAAACTDRTPTEGAPPTVATGEGVGMQIACTASVAAKQVRCGAPAPSGGASASIIVGGQGTYLRLETSGAEYDSAAHVFSLGAAVRNLLAQQMGTPDGKTATGVRVFFEQEPVATDGGGEITVANADGEASFTRLAQPYFDYPQIVAPGAASQFRTWRFNVPPAVRTFHFTVYVRTELPAEQGVLRWVQEFGAPGYYLKAVSAWGPSPTAPGTFHALAVGEKSVLDERGSYIGSRGVILATHGDGNWSEEYRPDFRGGFNDVWAGPHVSVAVGSRVGENGGRGSGLILRRVAGRWEDVTPASANDVALGAVWGSADEVYAFGLRHTGPRVDLVAYRSTDAATWSETTIPVHVEEGVVRATRVTGAWGSGSGVLRVTGTMFGFEVGLPVEGGFSAYYDGTRWSTHTRLYRRLADVWSSGDTVFVTDTKSVSWSVVGSGQSPAEKAIPGASAVWGSSGRAVYVVGDGGVHAFDGIKWYTTGVGSPIVNVGGWDRHVYAVGGGSIFRGTR